MTGQPPKKDTAEDSKEPESSAGRAIAKRLETELEPVVGDPAVRAKVVARTQQFIAAEFYRGKLPHPRHFAEFEAAAPGTASRIVAMAEHAQSRADDRMDCVVANEHSYSMHGLYLAAFVLLVFVVGGVVLCLNGHEIIGGGLLALSGLAVIASKFIDGKRRPDEDED